MFYFQQLLNTALGGIDGTNVIPTVTNMAFAILLIGFLVGLYQAVLRGGDLQALAVTAIKYLVVAMIAGDPAGTTTVLMLLVAYVVYALAIIVFCFFYTLFGCVLYVLGPLVLALIPVSGIGQLGKTYAISVMIWNGWGILYAVFGALITATHFNQVSDVLGNGFLGFLRGVPDSVILGLVSIAYALAIALVPFISRKVISGD